MPLIPEVKPPAIDNITKKPKVRALPSARPPRRCNKGP